MRHVDWIFAVFLVLVGAFAMSSRAAEPERFALLVGETNYIQPKDGGVTLLKGPANDVEAIKQLLIKRYGFINDDHIRVLTGPNASKKGIEDAFKGQLIENAKRHPNAVVVFYFSGHGSTTADTNGDEGGGDDQTLVAYDSRGPNGKDIVDDDIDVWLNQLRRVTPNITVILDSCYSGSATRGGAVSRSLPPNPNMAQPRGDRKINADPTPHLLRSRTYTAISASMSTESSYEGAIEAAGGKTHGYLTWFLTQTLDRRPYLTWRQAMSEIQRGVASVSQAQHPQDEGDIDRTVFGLAGDRSWPYVQLTAQDPAGNIMVAAGVAQGVVEGGTLAIYAPTAKVLNGDIGKIATARVISVGPSSSRAVVFESTVHPLPANAKVTIVTPFYGTKPIQIRLDTLPDESVTPQDAVVLGDVRASLSRSVVAKPAGANDAWVAAVQKGCLDGNGDLRITLAQGGCKPVYYIAGRQSREPVLSRYVPVGLADSATQLADALKQFARVSALRALTNDNSPLRLSLEMMQTTVTETPDGNLVVGPITPLPRPTTPLSARVGDWFTFKVTNRSARDVYAALLILNGDGSIALLSDDPKGDLVKAGGSMIYNTPVQAARPLGLDTYKVIATTKRDVDFSVLSTPDQQKGVWSPLERILAEASSTTVKNGDPARGNKLGDWVTIQTDVKVLPGLDVPAPGQTVSSSRRR